MLFSQVHMVDMDGDARPFWLPLSRHVFQWVPRLSSHEAILNLIVVPQGANLPLLCLIAGFIHALAFWVSGTGSTERIKILRTPSRATGTSGMNRFGSCWHFGSQLTRSYLADCKPWRARGNSSRMRKRRNNRCSPPLAPFCFEFGMSLRDMCWLWIMW